jgi:ATP-dependent Lhr-like helicase
VPSAFARFPPQLQEAIVARLGWTELRPVQELASQAILDESNAIVLAPTAGGKTEASMFPVLARLLEQPPSGVGALYIAPIKALLNNQAERLGLYTEMVGLRRFLWHGDVTAAQKRAFCKEPAPLLMTTPESLEVMLLSAKVPVAKLFKDLRMVVIDEVHALAGQDRGAHLMAVLQRLSQYSSHDLQRIGLSATVGNPEDILTWLAGSSKRPRIIVDPPKKPQSRDLRIALYESLRELSQSAAQAAAGNKSLFFCQSRALSEEVAQQMRGGGIDVFVHHSSVSLEERQAAEERFHHGRDAVIVCTSTLELGIDVGDLDKVLQAEAPSTVSSFLQRMGRTGRRAAARANTFFLCQESESALQAAALIELAREGWVESVPVLKRCWPVLVHQLLALSLQHNGVTLEQAHEALDPVPDFQGIRLEEFDQLVEHLVKSDFLYRTDDGRLNVGEQTERVFGRKNFMELYAVFSSPQLYAVVTANGKSVGSLEQNFVDRLVDGVSSFLLGGRGWIAEQVRHSDRTVLAHPAPAGRKPAWGGYIPQLLGFRVCRKMAELLASEAPLAYLDPVARASLDELRRDQGTHLRERSWYLEGNEKGLHLLTFAGGAVNQTIKYGLQILKNWALTADNFRLRLPEEVGATDLLEALPQIAHPEFWAKPETQERLLASLPEYRLSKFQPALPHRFALESVHDYLLDIPTTLEFLR